MTVAAVGPRGTGRAARPRFRRVSWGLADQAAGSLTTLCLSVAVLRTSAAGAAEFALVFLVHSLAVGFCRSITTEPVAHLLPGESVDRLRQHVRVAALTGLAVGLCSALLSGVFVRPDTVVGLWSLAFAVVVVPTDAVRAAWIGAGRAARAVPRSAVQFVASVVGLVAVVLGAPAVWAMAPVVCTSAVLTLAALLRGPRFRSGALRPPHWIYAVEWSFTSGLAQSSGLVVAGLGLPLLPLLLRAQGVVFGPLSSLSQAVAALAVPEFATTRRARLLRPALHLSAGLVGLCGLYALTVLVLPDEVLAAVLGTAAESFLPVLPAAAAAVVASGAAMGPLVALRAHGAARASLAARVVVGTSHLALQVAGALLWGPLGFFSAAAAAGLLGGTWAALVLRRTERADVGAAGEPA